MSTLYENQEYDHQSAHQRRLAEHIVEETIIHRVRKRCDLGEQEFLYPLSRIDLCSIQDGALIYHLPISVLMKSAFPDILLRHGLRPVYQKAKHYRVVAEVTSVDYAKLDPVMRLFSLSFFVAYSDPLLQFLWSYGMDRNMNLLGKDLLKEEKNKAQFFLSALVSGFVSGLGKL